ncbi:MAG TPA: hypothetical protein DDW65_25435 [Firmicutes bacterium]|jgi:hypothetical protein|nr:hypothetical protein [Bacillota bacterium]
MHKEKLKTIAADLIGVINGSSEPGIEGELKTRFFNHKGVYLNLIDSTADLFESIIRKILNENNLGEKFTEKYIESRLLDIIKDYIDNGSTEECLLLSLSRNIKELEDFNDEFIVIIPVDGLKSIDLKRLDIGKVTLFEMTAEKGSVYFDTIEKVILTSKNTKEQQQMLIERQRERFNELIGCICSEYKVIAEPTRAVERAEQQTKLALGIIGFGIPIFYSDDLRIKLALKGEISRERRCTPVLATDKNRWSLNHKKIGPLTNFELKKENLERLNKLKILTFSDMLKKDNQNDLELALLRSLHCSFFSHCFNSKYGFIINFSERIIIMD